MLAGFEDLGAVQAHPAVFKTENFANKNLSCCNVTIFLEYNKQYHTKKLAILWSNAGVISS